MPDLANIDALFAFMEQAGREFDAEPVDVCTHGLQCAALLETEAPDDIELQIAGLFHDLGSALAPGRSATHARTGAAAVAPLVGVRVARLVTGHDDAKRYLVTTEAHYRELLSPQSLATLRVQGGLMDPVERAAFERRPDFAAVLTLATRRRPSEGRRPARTGIGALAGPASRRCSAHRHPDGESDPDTVHSVRVLITNDDGVEAPGLHALALAVHRAGHDVMVVAPSGERSGSGAAIGRLHRGGPHACTEVSWPELPGVPVYAIDVPPAATVYAGALGAFGPRPDAVASGINPGMNYGHLVLHSGTVGAALTAAVDRNPRRCREHRLGR